MIGNWFQYDSLLPRMAASQPCRRIFARRRSSGNGLCIRMTLTTRVIRRLGVNNTFRTAILHVASDDDQVTTDEHWHVVTLVHRTR